MEDLKPSKILMWGVVALVVLSVVTFGLSTVFRTADVVVDRKVIEQSRQYAETNTAAFYERLETIKKIDVQIAGLPEGDPQIAPLKSQRDLMTSEARREVAKIPADSRTPDMAPFLSGAP